MNFRFHCHPLFCLSISSLLPRYKTTLHTFFPSFLCNYATSLSFVPPITYFYPHTRQHPINTFFNMPPKAGGGSDQADGSPPQPKTTPTKVTPTKEKNEKLIPTLSSTETRLLAFSTYWADASKVSLRFLHTTLPVF